MEYRITSADGSTNRIWHDERCAPAKSAMESMINAGCSLYIDGKKQTKATALKLEPKPWTKKQLDSLPDVELE